jgi:hypothetical protein
MVKVFFIIITIFLSKAKELHSIPVLCYDEESSTFSLPPSKSSLSTLLKKDVLGQKKLPETKKSKKILIKNFLQKYTNHFICLGGIAFLGTGIKCYQLYREKTALNLLVPFAIPPMTNHIRQIILFLKRDSGYNNSSCRIFQRLTGRSSKTSVLNFSQSMNELNREISHANHSSPSRLSAIPKELFYQINTLFNIVQKSY